MTTVSDKKAAVEGVEQTLDGNADDAAAVEAVENARALALRDGMIPRLHTGEPAYKRFAPEMLSLVAKTIMPSNYSLPELYMGLEIAATYGLDPFTKELWLIRMKSDGPVVPLVGRDGLLAIADRHKDYRGFREGAVYENDTFSVQDEPYELPNGQQSYVKHSVNGFARGGEKGRGALLGAWAEVYREGRPPTYFIAYLTDYDRGGNTPWGKGHKDVMIIKVALVNALRKAFRISGVYLGDEQTGGSLEMSGARETKAGELVPLHEDPAWAARFEALFRARNEITPGTYYPGKQRVLIEGCKSEEELQILAARLEDELVAAGGVVPSASFDEEPAEVLEGEVAEPEQTTMT